MKKSYLYWIYLRNNKPLYAFIIFLMTMVPLSICIGTIGSVASGTPEIEELECSQGLVVDTYQPRSKRRLNSHVTIRTNGINTKYESRSVSKVIANSVGKEISYCYVDRYFLIGGHFSLHKQIVQAEIDGVSISYQQTKQEFLKRIKTTRSIFNISFMFLFITIIIHLVGAHKFSRKEV